MSGTGNRPGWLIRLPPLPGELLSSCLARNAYAHGSTPYRFLGVFWHRDPVWERDFDRDPASLLRTRRGAGAPNWLDDVANQLRVPRETVERATLLELRKRLGGPGLPDRGDTPLLLSAGIHHRSRTRHALQYCPECLTDGTAHFRQEWRLGFVACCEKHGRPMLDACPHCQANIVPHRSMTTRLTDCHQCGQPLASSCVTASDADVSERAASLQARLLSALQATPDAGDSASNHVLLADLRALLAVSAAAPVHVALRQALGLNGNLPAAGGRLRFEHSRLAVRIPWLETVAAWTADWPRSFRNGADAAGLTRRTFARTRPGPALAEEVRRLPLGQRRDRTWLPILEEPVLRRLRRTDPAAYRAERARRILAATRFIT